MSLEDSLVSKMFAYEELDRVSYRAKEIYKAVVAFRMFECEMFEMKFEMTCFKVCASAYKWYFTGQITILAQSANILPALIAERNAIAIEVAKLLSLPYELAMLINNAERSEA